MGHGERVAIASVNGRFEAYGHDVEIDVLETPTYAVVYFYVDPNFDRYVLRRGGKPVGKTDRVRLGIVDHHCELYLAPSNG